MDNVKTISDSQSAKGTGIGSKNMPTIPVVYNSISNGKSLKESDRWNPFYPTQVSSYKLFSPFHPKPEHPIVFVFDNRYTINVNVYTSICNSILLLIVFRNYFDILGHS